MFAAADAIVNITLPVDTLVCPLLYPDKLFAIPGSDAQHDNTLPEIIKLVILCALAKITVNQS